MTGMVASSLILHKPSSELWPALLRVLSLPVGWEVASLHGRETSSLPHGPSWSGVPSSSSLILFLSCVVQARKMFLEKIIVSFAPRILGSALGAVVFHGPNGPRHRETKPSSLLCFRAGTTRMAHRSAEYCEGNLKPPSQPQSDVLTQTIVENDGWWLMEQGRPQSR